MKILFVTDRPLCFREELEKRGHQVMLTSRKDSLTKDLHDFNPDEIHLMEPLPFWRRLALNNRPFKAHFFSLPFPKFYKKAEKIFVPNRGAKNFLQSRGITCPIEVIGQVVAPVEPTFLADFDRPIFLLHGEENVEEFCKMPLPGTKIILGKARKNLSHKALFYPNLPGITESLLATADVLVTFSTKELFPEIFLKAGLAGLPIASHPSLGAKEYIRNGINGHISHDLSLAALKCLTIDKEHCKQIARSYTIPLFCDKLGQ